jgi:Acyclic terpene utilisation family protein AtuA
VKPPAIDSDDELRILSPTAILGYGFPAASFDAGMALRPHVIAVDAGSSDPGPYYLGAGISFTDRDAVKRDLAIMLQAARARHIPLIVGSCGGAGGDPHLAWTAEIVREIAAENNLSFRMALIGAEIEKSVVLEALERGRLSSCGPWPDLTRKDVEASVRIVAQIGVEPLIDALILGADVVLAGRAYDPAVFAALPIQRGFDPGLALHLGKILECAAIACAPGSGSDCMFGILRRDHFLLRPLNPARACTVASVGAHTLYEKSDPYRLPGPGGMLDLTNSRFEQVDERTVRVFGSRHVDQAYALKLEGAARVGYRTISIAGVRDPVFISQVEDIIAAVRGRTADNFSNIPAESYSLLFRLYGRDGVMGALEPMRDHLGHELGIVIEAVAPTQELANTICGFARSTMLHYGYPGRISTAGNLAFPYSPSDLKAGEVYRFSIYHLLPTHDPRAFSPIHLEIVGEKVAMENAI